MHATSRRGMTLVELLVVMVIITILGALVLAVLRRGPPEGLRTRTQVDVSALATAVEAYRLNYGEWPVTNENAYATDATLTALFRGTNVTSEGRARNTRQIKLLDVRDAAVGASGWQDPWGKPYFFAVDQDGDGIITAQVIERGRFGQPILHGTLVVTGRQVIAFSFGPNTNLNLNVTDPAYDDLRSW